MTALKEAFMPFDHPDGQDPNRMHLIQRLHNSRGWMLEVIKYDNEPHIGVTAPEGELVFEPPILGVGLDAYPNLKVPAYVKKECAKLLEEARSWGGGEELPEEPAA